VGEEGGWNDDDWRDADSFQDVDVCVFDFAAIQAVEYLHQSIQVVDHCQVSWVQPILLVSGLVGKSVEEWVRKQPISHQVERVTAVLGRPTAANLRIEGIGRLGYEKVASEHNNQQHHDLPQDLADNLLSYTPSQQMTLFAIAHLFVLEHFWLGFFQT